ncbi:uncharacterized protein [Clytia hemisphaerica]|uniref:uncharacterized protein isoform X2 n=1 Tax=Clytia hemisphaerica TaxID=252671 RepID=UPI0034D3EB1E
MNVANWMKITKYIIPRFSGAAQNSELQITHDSDNIEVGEDIVIECCSNHPVNNVESQAPQNHGDSNSSLNVDNMGVSDNSSSVEVSMTSSLTADGIDQESQITGDSSAMDVRNNGSISFDSMDKETQPSGTLAVIDAGDASSVSDTANGTETSGNSLPVQIKSNFFIGNEDNACSKDFLEKKIEEEIANANSSIIVDDGQLPCFSGYIKQIKNVDDANNVGKLTQASTDDDSTALETSDGSQFTITPGQYGPNEAPAENLNSKLGDLNCDDHIDPPSTISDGNLGKNVSGNDSDHGNSEVQVGSRWKNLKVEKSGLFDVIFAIVGLLLVLIIFLIAQRTHVPPTIKTNKPTGITQPLINGLKYIESGSVRLYAYVGSATAQLTKPILIRLNEMKQSSYNAFHGLYQSIGIALSALVQPLSGGIEYIQNGFNGLYVYAIGFITPPPKTLWNHMTDMLSYVTVKKEQPRGYGIENTLFYMWQPEPLKTKNNENLMIYVLCYVVLLVTFLVVRQPLASLLEKFDYGIFKNIGGYLSKGKWFLLMIGAMVGVVALVVYFNADMISACSEWTSNLVTYTKSRVYKKPEPEPTFYQHFCAALMVFAMLFVFIAISSVVIFQMHYISDGVYDFSRRKVLTSTFIILTTIAIGVCGIAGYESFGKMNSSDSITFVYLLTLIFFTLIV